MVTPANRVEEGWCHVITIDVGNAGDEQSPTWVPTERQKTSGKNPIQTDLREKEMKIY